MTSKLVTAILLIFSANLAIGAGLGTELKVSLKADDLIDVVRKLELPLNKAEKRKIHYFDTENLELYQQGLVLRSRVDVETRKTDSTIKVRPLNPDQVPSEWYKLNGFKCEQDIMLDRQIESCSFSADIDESQLQNLLRAPQMYSLNHIFSNQQELFSIFTKRVHLRSVDYKVLGPVDSYRWKIEALYLGRITIELWILPNREILLEASTKTEPRKAKRQLKRLIKFFKQKEVDVLEKSSTKTKKALETLLALNNI